MSKVFIGKNGKAYSIQDLQQFVIPSNKELLEQYSMEELEDIYKSYDKHLSKNLSSIILQEKIKIYDKSNEVNSFIYKDNSYWLDKSARNGLRNLLNSGLETFNLVLGDSIITIDKEMLSSFLNSLEIYANKCYVCTHKHLINIKQLKNKEDIMNYDYTTGYPEKVILE